jgi:ATP:ADP antiporter, AAA family
MRRIAQTREFAIRVRILDALSRRLGLEPHERGLLLLMCALVTSLLTAYTIAKVQRDATFIAEFGAGALPIAYIAVALATAAFVWVEGRFASRYTRIAASRLNQYLAIAISLLAIPAFAAEPHWTAAAFYVWTGSQAMMLLPHFWVLALDVWDSRRARQVFPVLSGFGLVGGLLGGGFAGWISPILGRAALEWALAILLVVSFLLTRALERHRHERAPTAATSTAAGSKWKIVRRSNYLKYLAAALALSVIVSTLVDFQFKFFIQDIYPDTETLSRFLGRFYLILNGLALVFQFGAVGWLLTRLGLVASTGLQPALIMIFSWWVALSTGWWAVIALRWVQGVVLQGIGKSSAEIYYMAVRPSERRSIKPAIDTLVERWSDAAVGVFLILMMRVAGAALSVIAITTVVIAAVWLFVLFRLNRRYARAFEQALSSRWLDPEGAAESMRVPAARRAIEEALQSPDEARALLSLDLARYTRHPRIARAVIVNLDRPSPAVRAAAIRAMESLRLRDDRNRIQAMLSDPDDRVVRAAVSYELAMSARQVEYARAVLEGTDPRLRAFMLEALLERPSEAPGAVTTAWIDRMTQSENVEDRVLAARALGTMTSAARVPRLLTCLEQPSVDVRRAALQSAARRPNRQVLDALIPFLVDPELSYDARLAVAALRNAAIPALRPYLSGVRGTRAQAQAARTLARIATPDALRALLALVRSSDLSLRHLGLESASRIRVAVGRPVMSRSRVHKLFLRELREYRQWIAPSRVMARHDAPEVRLLGESFREYAEMALERGFRALACWYDPKPLSGAYERLKTRDTGDDPPALEFLSHILPREIFGHLVPIFEAPATPAASGETQADDLRQGLAGWIATAWRSGDAWLRACAVRASRWAPDLDPTLFDAPEADEASSIVRAELKAIRTPSEEAPSWILTPRPLSP